MISYRVTVGDPTTFTRAWTIEMPFIKRRSAQPESSRRRVTRQPGYERYSGRRPRDREGKAEPDKRGVQEEGNQVARRSNVLSRICCWTTLWTSAVGFSRENLTRNGGPESDRCGWPSGPDQTGDRRHHGQSMTVAHPPSTGRAGMP